MNDSIICFTLGLSQQDIEAGMAAFDAVDQSGTRLQVTPVTEDLLALTVGEAVDKKAEALRKNETIDPSIGFNGVTPASGHYRVVLINSQDRQQVIQIMRSFKTVLPDPQEVIFAMITETAWTWTFQYYFEHLTKEHEYMKTHSPKHDPDMKPM
jgi:hypothetical protein